MLNSIYGIKAQALSSFVADNFPSYRAKQLLSWLYKKMVFDIDQMSDLPLDFKLWLKDSFDFSLPTILAIDSSKDGTQKFLLELADQKQIECVLIPEGKKNTLCVSSQTGCARACSFCATGTLGAGRNLLPHEIIQQLLLASQHIYPKRITNIVFMGMGEPMDNLDNVLNALELLQDEAGVAFSPRRTTISTCGVLPGITKLADSKVKVKLALSLNSAIDSVRDELMKVNRIYPLASLKRALKYYNSKNPFRITFEYILIPDVNMDAASIKALKRFTSDLSAKINFIPYNFVASLPYRAPTKAEVESFMSAAASLPQAIMLRKSRGGDINGACGQLALNHKPKKLKEKT